MIGGYEIKQAGLCPFEGVKTRRFLNAPISMDFKHTLRSYMTRERLDLHSMIEREREARYDLRMMRYKTRIRLPGSGLRLERWLDVDDLYLLSDKTNGLAINMQLNCITDSIIKDFKPMAIKHLMQQYNQCDIIVRIGTRRIATHE